jgi:serine phosphatase RsbU (regulator of sigma subunit)
VRAIYAVLDPGTGQLNVAGAGHPRPMRWSREAPAIRVLQTAGAPLGLLKGAEFEGGLHPVTVTLAAGDHVLFHTLGVTHAANEREEEIGERGIARAMRVAPDGIAGLALVEVLEAVLTHRGSGTAGDMTLIELCRESQDA